MGCRSAMLCVCVVVLNVQREVMTTIDRDRLTNRDIVKIVPVSLSSPDS